MMPTQGCKDAALLQVVYLRGFEIRGPVGAIWAPIWGPVACLNCVLGVSVLCFSAFLNTKSAPKNRVCFSVLFSSLIGCHFPIYTPFWDQLEFPEYPFLGSI